MARLDEIPGVGRAAARVIIAEIGLDMSRFPTPAHLASWAQFAPGSRSPPGKKKGRGLHRPRQPRTWPGRWARPPSAAGKTDTFLGERYRRIARRRGSKRAMVAVGRSILVIIWHLLSDPDARFHDLGPDFYDTRIDADRTQRNHIRQLEALGLQGHPRTRRLTRILHTAWTRLRFAAPGAVACLVTVDFRISHRRAGTGRAGHRSGQAGP